MNQTFYNLKKSIHKFLYHLTRTRYGRKFYGQIDTDEEVEFEKCYYFSKIAASYLIKYSLDKKPFDISNTTISDDYIKIRQ